MIASVHDENWTRAAVRLLGDAAPIDRDTVARLRRAIADRSYHVDAATIATAMVDTDLPRAQPDKRC